jgi:ABC-type transporter Mla subunit MlaD
MNRDRNALKAGIFIICSVIAAGAIIMSIRGAGHVIEPMADRRATFQISDDLGGLRNGDDVRLGGFRIGTVRNIDVVAPKDEKSEPHIVVSFSIPARYRLREDSKVVAEATLTGVASLNIERLGNGAEVAEAVGRPSSMAQLLTGLGNATPDLQEIVHDARTITVPKVNSAVDRANALLAHVDAKIDPVVTRYDGVTERASEALAQARDLIGDTKPDIRGTMKNLNGATRTINQRLPALIEQVNVAIDKVQGTLDTARTALLDIKKITETGKGVIAGNRGKLESIIASLKSTSDNLKGASIEIRRSPWRLLYKPTAGEMANLNLYDAARQFADGADNLTDAATALRDAVNDGNTDKQQVRKLMDQLDSSFANFQQVEDKLWSSVKQ